MGSQRVRHDWVTNTHTHIRYLVCARLCWVMRNTEVMRRQHPFLRSPESPEWWGQWSPPCWPRLFGSSSWLYVLPTPFPNFSGLHSHSVFWSCTSLRSGRFLPLFSIQITHSPSPNLDATSPKKPSVRPLPGWVVPLPFALRASPILSLGLLYWNQLLPCLSLPLDCKHLEDRANTEFNTVNISCSQKWQEWA